MIGNAQDARSALEAAVSSSGGQLDARLLLANVDLKLRDRAAAEDQLEAVLLLDPANHNALLGLAREQLEEKRFTEVVNLLGPRVQGASADLLQLLVQAYLGLGRTADAERVRGQLHGSQRRR
jgi:Tfp pilus assembly protein PilF